MATRDAGALRTLENLLALLRTTRTDIEEAFRELHHFSKRPPFNTQVRGFAHFVSYCERLSRGITPGGENERTIQRAYFYAERRGTMGHALALYEAWQAFPLVRSQ